MYVHFHIARMSAAADLSPHSSASLASVYLKILRSTYVQARRDDIIEGGDPHHYELIFNVFCSPPCETSCYIGNLCFFTYSPLYFYEKEELKEEGELRMSCYASWLAGSSSGRQGARSVP